MEGGDEELEGEETRRIKLEKLRKKEWEENLQRMKDFYQHGDTESNRRSMDSDEEDEDDERLERVYQRRKAEYIEMMTGWQRRMTNAVFARVEAEQQRKREEDRNVRNGISSFAAKTKVS
jgi:hypothetical protein